MSREDFAKVYLDWVNNFLTIDRFAEYYGLNPREAIKLIELGKSCHDLPHPDA